MTSFSLNNDSKLQVWSSDVTRDYLRASGLMPYISKGGIIDIRNELGGKAGYRINVPVMSKLRGNVVRGSTPLVGNEDVQNNYNMAIYTDYVRTAVVVPGTEIYKTDIDLLNEGKLACVNRLKEAYRDDIITALRAVPTAGSGTGSNPTDNSTTYELASAAQQNAWQVANADRVLYGALNSNMTAGNHATSLGTINASSASLTANKISAQTVSLARMKARLTTTSSTFSINPYQTKNGSEWYVMFTDANGYRDAKNDPVIYAANKDARPRETDILENPIFSGTNTLYYDGVIIVEMPELPTVATNVGYAHLCGLQAVLTGYNQKVKANKRAENDYGMINGYGVEEIRGQSKGSVNQTQVGMVSVFHSSVPNA